MEKEKFDYYIKTEKNSWEVVIGLEVHAQVISDSKISFFDSSLFLRLKSTVIKNSALYADPDFLIEFTL